MAIEADISPQWYIAHTYSGHEEKLKRNKWHFTAYYGKSHPN